MSPRIVLYSADGYVRLTFQGYSAVEYRMADHGPIYQLSLRPPSEDRPGSCWCEARNRRDQPEGQAGMVPTEDQPRIEGELIDSLPG